MFDLDKWQEIFGTIRQNKLRTFLTAFGVFWGIFMLILLLGAGRGMQNGVGQEFADEAMNSVWVWQGKTSMPYQGMKAGREIRFTNEDLKLIANDLGDKTNMIAPRNNLFGEYTMNYKNKNGSYRVFGSVGEFFKLNGEKMVKGRNLNQKDIEEKRKVVVIGEKVRKTLFGDKEAIGEYINIKGVYFKVIGIFTTNQNQGRNEERAYIPFSTLQTVFNQLNQVHMFGMNAVDGVSAYEVENTIRKVLSTKYKFDPQDRQAIWLNNNEENFARFQGLFKGIETFVWFVGIGTLIAGIVGVSNIMLIIVKERTKEIGIRKAIGATPWSIVSLILQESIFITGFSGYMGMLLSIGLLDSLRYLIEATGAELPYFTRPEVDTYVAVSATLILVLAGALAGLIPALKAANIKPIEALRAD